MRLQIYVPQRATDAWEPTSDFITWQEFQRRAARGAGSLTVMPGVRVSPGESDTNVFVVEAIVDAPQPGEVGWTAVHRTWAAFSEYAQQLRNRGYLIVLVKDGERVDF